MSVSRSIQRYAVQRRMAVDMRRGARSGSVKRRVTPQSLGLRVMFDVANWDTDHIVGTGSTAATLTVATNGPTYSAADADYNNLPTLAFDGVNDHMNSNVVVWKAPDSTLGLVGEVTGAGDGVYLLGQYTNSGYFFLVYDASTDTLRSDQAGLSIPGADMANPHFWLFVLTTNTVTVYRDGLLMGSGTVTLHSGTNPNAGGFWTGDAGGGGYSALKFAESFTLDRALTAAQALSLYRDYARPKYNFSSAYPQREIWLALGDSYCAGPNVGVAGVDAPPAGYPPADGTLFMFTSTGWDELSEPCTGNASDSIGPYGMFGWLSQQARGGEVAIVNCGVGGSTSTQWLPGTANYNAALRRILAATARPNSVFRGFLIANGLNDAAAGATSSWRANWNTIVAAIQSDLGPQRSKPLVVVQQMQTTEPTDQPYPGLTAVRADITAFVADDPDNRFETAADEGPWREVTKVHPKTGVYYIYSGRTNTVTQSYLG